MLSIPGLRQRFQPGPGHAPAADADADGQDRSRMPRMVLSPVRTNRDTDAEPEHLDRRGTRLDSPARDPLMPGMTSASPERAGPPGHPASARTTSRSHSSPSLWHRARNTAGPNPVRSPSGIGDIQRRRVRIRTTAGQMTRRGCGCGYGEQEAGQHGHKAESKVKAGRPGGIAKKDVQAYMDPPL